MMSPPDAARISEIATERRDELVELLLSFVRVRAENPPGTGHAESQAWIGEALTRFGIPFEVHRTARSSTGHAVIIGEIGDTGPFVYLHGHYDVVPGFDDRQFEPALRDGAVFGRGACDMKGGIVAMLLGATIHRDLGGAGRVRLVIVPDEETGGADGSERMAELGLVETENCVGAIVGEPSYPDIWYAARGAFTVEVTVRGRPAHVGLHYTGQNAFERAHRVLSRMFEWRDRVQTVKTEYRIEPEAARSSIALIGGMAGGGTNFNVVPEEFRFTIDRRPNPDEDYDEAKNEMVGLLEGMREEFDLSYEVLQDARPAGTAADHPLITAVQSNVSRISDRHAPVTMCPGCLETRIYDQAGIPAVAYGPGPMAAMHAPDEHVPIDNLVEACAVYAATLGDLLGYEQYG